MKLECIYIPNWWVYKEFRLQLSDGVSALKVETVKENNKCLWFKCQLRRGMTFKIAKSLIKKRFDIKVTEPKFFPFISVAETELQEYNDMAKYIEESDCCKCNHAKMTGSDNFREYYKCPDCGKTFSINYDEIR